jgi:hypothetical protein
MVWYVAYYVVMLLKGLVNCLYKAILSKLKEKAYQAYSQYRTGNPASNELPEADELTMFGGQTRVILSKTLSSQSPTGSQSQSAPPSAPIQSKSNGSSTLISAKDVHPALMEYLSMFPVNDNLISSRPPEFDHQHDIAMFSSVQQEYPPQENHNTQFYWEPPPPPFSTPTPPSNYTSFHNSSFTPSFPPPLFVPHPEFETTQSKNDFYQGNFFDLGMMIASDLNEQWTSFVPANPGLGSYDVGETTACV